MNALKFTLVIGLITSLVGLTDLYATTILKSGAYDETEILKKIDSNSEKIIVDNAEISLISDWDLRSLGTVQLIIRGSGSLLFESHKNLNYKLTLAEGSCILIENKDNPEALVSAKAHGQVRIVIGNTSVRGVDFTEVIREGGTGCSDSPVEEPKLISLTTKVWNDRNSNGIMDSSEKGIEGVEVVLYFNGTEFSRVKSDQSGWVEFEGLEPGRFQLAVMKPETYSFTGKRMGNGSNDSNVDPETGMTEEMELVDEGDYSLGNVGMYASLLPLQFGSIAGTAVEERIEIEWETYQEFNTLNFVIERSGNGHNFIPIGTVEAKGLSTESQIYDFVDTDPVDGVNFYRIRQTDKSREYQYSDVFKVEYDSPNTLSISTYPNPFVDRAVIKSGDAAIKEVILYSTNGQVVKKHDNRGKNVMVELNGLGDFQPGIYFLKVVDSNNNSYTGKLVKR